MDTMIKKTGKKDNIIVLISGAIAIATGLYAILLLPHERSVSSLGIFLFKLLPFISGSVAIAFFNKDYLIKTRLILPAFWVAFLIYFAFFVPKLFESFPEDWNSMYYYTLMEVPFIILFVTLVYRMGGASSGNTLKLAFSLLAIMLSGIEDLAFHIVNRYKIPEVWDWASHIQVRLGHFPTKYEAYGFIAFHFILAALIAFLPWGKIAAKMRPKNIGI